METLNKIKVQGELAATKLQAGEKLTKDELTVLEIYNQLHAKKPTNGGNRQNRVKKQRI